MLDLGPTFRPESEHLGRLLTDRDQVNQGRIELGVSFLDDCLGGVYPRDLLLLGAGTGIGKTGLAVSAALAGAEAGRDVFLFALEAEVGEVAARLYFQELGKISGEKRLDFAGWWRGHWPSLDRRYGEEVKDKLRPILSRVHTLYKRQGDFTVESLAQQLEEIRTRAGMVVLDHIHVVDAKGSESELKTQARTVRILRDIALSTGVPVVVASHLRKKQPGDRIIFPEIDDLHGASDLSKVATQVVLFARDWNAPKEDKHLAPTLMRVAKDRRGRAAPLVARVNYDMSRGQYEDSYELGKLEVKDRKQQWRSVGLSQVPAWATRDAHKAEEGLPF